MLTESDIKIIKKCFLFEDVTNEEFLTLNDGFKIAEFKKDEAIFPEGEPLLGLLLSGNAIAECSGSNNGSLKTFTTGEIFGAASVFCEDVASTFSKMKAASFCRVFFINRISIEKLIKSKPDRAIKYIKFLSNRVEFLNKRISTFTSNQAVNRLARYILDTEINGVCENISFVNIARSLDISRASFYRAKDELESLGAATFDAKKIKLLNKNVLMTFLQN